MRPNWSVGLGPSSSRTASPAKLRNRPVASDAQRSPRSGVSTPNKRTRPSSVSKVSPSMTRLTWTSAESLHRRVVSRRLSSMLIEQAAMAAKMVTNKVGIKISFKAHTTEPQ